MRAAILAHAERAPSGAERCDESRDEWLHVPAIAYAIAEPFTRLAEWVFWQRHTPDGDIDVDESSNVTLSANF